jgi:type I restriction enzyme M protein
VLKKKREHKDNVLFINASQYFERGTQNILRPSDINKILETFKDRKEIESYSKISSLAEIADNQYNLNIPRYVNTFEEEETIDLKEVSKHLKNLEKNLQKADNEIAKFCKELKIDTPF